MGRKNSKYAEALKVILSIIRENGPLTSKEILDKVPKKYGERTIKDTTFYEVLKDEADSPVGQILKLPTPGMTYYYTPNQASPLTKRIAGDLINGKIRTQARLDVWKLHSEKINVTLKELFNQLPTISLEPKYPAGGLQLKGRTDVKSYGLGSRCEVGGPRKLPIEDDDIFIHMFEHDEIGQSLLDEYHEHIEALIDFEIVKGRLYRKLDEKIRDRIALIDDGLLVTETFTDELYDLLVVNKYSFEEMVKWRLVNDGTFYRVNRGDDVLNDGWLFVRDGDIVGGALEQNVNQAYQQLLEYVRDGSYRDEVSIISAEFERLNAAREHFTKKVKRLSLREIYSMCPLVMTM